MKKIITLAFIAGIALVLCGSQSSLIAREHSQFSLGFSLNLIPPPRPILLPAPRPVQLPPYSFPERPPTCYPQIIVKKYPSYYHQHVVHALPYHEQVMMPQPHYPVFQRVNPYCPYN